ncbi:MAG: hypothetical protein JOY56_04905 [Solirubrobacterales bacterium]|nr:hypothetical protein [Solirubrobacterales bacterium]MBV9362930.1 hypothetical protein [Solirubrobacterales bacterium]MBV9680163.1 hypothetical protein [Solirubrobacterales bacterium]MBV9807130.1 hypothetical protein [Solirubrobacterales bacterium]
MSRGGVGLAGRTALPARRQGRLVVVAAPDPGRLGVREGNAPSARSVRPPRRIRLGAAPAAPIPVGALGRRIAGIWIKDGSGEQDRRQHDGQQRHRLRERGIAGCHDARQTRDRRDRRQSHEERGGAATQTVNQASITLAPSGSGDCAPSVFAG